MRYKKGFKFKPSFQSSLEFYEFNYLDKETNLVHTIVHGTGGCTFDDYIEKEYYDAAFERGDYVAIA